MIPNEYIKNLYKLALVFFTILSLYFAVRLLAEYKYYRMANPGFNSITLSGHGEVSAVPDIANVYFTIRKEAKTVKEAQDAVAVVEKSALDFLKLSNVVDKDIKTSDASFYPKYDYVYDMKMSMPCTEFGCPPRPGKNVITGYEASESITVKIRDTDSVGKIMQGLGGLGVSDLSGPNFSVDDEDALKAEARTKAIADARGKAKVLAKDLGVKLGQIMSFGEDGIYPMPMYYGKDMMMSEGAVQTAPAQLPKGENTITSDVTITYEIR